MVYSHRVTRVNLLQRKAREFEENVRTRFVAEEGERLEVCLAAFKRLIDDKSASSQTSTRQLEKIADKISNWMFADSVSETFTQLLIELASFTNFNLEAYPGILETEPQMYLARLLSVASQIGLSSKQVATLQYDTEKRLAEIEQQVKIVLQFPYHEAISTTHNLLGFSPQFPTLLGLFESFPQGYVLLNTLALDDYMPHYMSASASMDWKVTRNELLRANSHRLRRNGIFGDMWDVVDAAHEALINVPVGFIDLDHELSVFLSALSDISLLAREHPQEFVNEVAVAEGIISKLEPLIPVLQGYAEAGLSEFSRERMQLIEKIHHALPPEAGIMLEPLLVRFVNLRFVNILERTPPPSSQPLFDPEMKSRLISFLETQVDGYIEAILRGDSRISIADSLTYEVSRSQRRPDPSMDGRFHDVDPHGYIERIMSDEMNTHFSDSFGLEMKAGRFEHELLRVTFHFADQFGIRILQNRMQTERITNFRLLIAACMQLGCAWDASNDWMWRDISDLPDSKLEQMVLVLSRMVARRNFLLSINEDETALFFTAEDWIGSFVQGEAPYAVQTGQVLFAKYVSDHLIPPLEFVPRLRQLGVLAENIRQMMTNFDIPQRLVALADRMKSLSRKHRRIGGGPFHGGLSPTQLLHNLFRIELFWGFMDAETPNLACRNALETLFMDAIELLEISVSDNTMRIVLSLIQLDPRQSEPNPVILTETDFARFATKVATISTEIKREKQTLLA